MKWIAEVLASVALVALWAWVAQVANAALDDAPQAAVAPPQVVSQASAPAPASVKRL